jgi:hypothetical protein
VLHGVAIACNRRTADLVITSPLLDNPAARDARRAATPKAGRTR